MTRFLLIAALATASFPATAAERNFSITSFDRIRVEGPFAVTLVTGKAPFARASGSAQGLDGVAVEINGRTLVIRPNRSSWGGYPGQQRGPVEISVGTHELRSAVLNGSGSLAINAVKGLAFDLTIQGAGTASIDQVGVDRLTTGIAGAGSARLAGKALKFTAVVRGTSALDAGALQVKDLKIGAEGPTTVRAVATNSADVTARGLSAVTLAGNPACKVVAEGSATVSGCR
ncbi:GIN domain-containing protein [Sphingomonas arenae]|uniref:GIN domain-containing protein n=1 Tax=Sphingomonas arenae TaxID=2812555 RepID=UPI0019673424|nr:DUF2807 domain-containing protein [Sphingomonas arenae]